jgi:hypothetical protein
MSDVGHESKHSMAAANHIIQASEICTSSSTDDPLDSALKLGTSSRAENSGLHACAVCDVNMIK